MYSSRARARVAVDQAPGDLGPLPATVPPSARGGAKLGRCTVRAGHETVLTSRTPRTLPREQDSGVVERWSLARPARARGQRRAPTADSFIRSILPAWGPVRMKAFVRAHAVRWLARRFQRPRTLDHATRSSVLLPPSHKRSRLGHWHLSLEDCRSRV